MILQDASQILEHPSQCEQIQGRGFAFALSRGAMAVLAMAAEAPVLAKSSENL